MVQPTAPLIATLARALLLLLASPASAQPRQSSPGEILRRAQTLRSTKHPDEAAALLTSYLAGSPNDPDALSSLAQIRLDQNRTADAEHLLARALEASPNSPSANDLSGKILLDQHRYPEAMDRFETVLGISLRDQEARQGEFSAATQLAIESRRAGRADAAFLCLQHAREHLPDDPVLLLDLGIQAEQVHQLPIAQDALEAALRLRPGDPQTLYALSRVELDRQQFPASERHLRAYLAMRPKDATAHFGLGHLLEMEQQHLDEAKSEFQRSIELQPVQTESYYQLGQIALDAGQPDVAAPLFEKALSRDPRHGGALTGAGILAYRRKDFADARRQLTAAVASSPDFQPAHYYLGLTLARLGEKADSERELQTATDLGRKQDPHAAAAAQRTGADISH